MEVEVVPRRSSCYRRGPLVTEILTQIWPFHLISCSALTSPRHWIAMGKKQQSNQKEFTTSAPSLPQKELYQRVNFAIQASAFLQSLAGPSISVDRKGKRKASHLDDVSHMTGHHPMESLAMATMKNTRKMVAHTQLKLYVTTGSYYFSFIHVDLCRDPSLKRNICRGCGTVLIPGATSRIRNRRRHQQ